MNGVDKYGVVGNPIAHSRSPEIHERFARQTRQKISYERISVPLDGFEEKALALRDAGYRGLNVTVPSKLDAAKLSDDLMPRARLAGAVNTLKFDGDTIIGDNTDGIGFVRDVRERLKFDFSECSVLVLGAGGAVRGVIGSLLDASPRWIAVANRTHQRAEELAEEFGVEAIHLDEIPAELCGVRQRPRRYRGVPAPHGERPGGGCGNRAARRRAGSTSPARAMRSLSRSASSG